MGNYYLLRNMSLNKSDGMDVVRGEFFKNAPAYKLRWLAKLFNQIF